MDVFVVMVVDDEVGIGRQSGEDGDGECPTIERLAVRYVGMVESRG
jgi:hypothetical protein